MQLLLSPGSKMSLLPNRQTEERQWILLHISCKLHNEFCRREHLPKFYENKFVIVLRNNLKL